MVGRRKLPNPSLNHIFNALSIGVQYTLSFELTNFGLKCLLIYAMIKSIIQRISSKQLFLKRKKMHRKICLKELFFSNFTASLPEFHSKRVILRLFLYNNKSSTRSCSSFQFFKVTTFSTLKSRQQEKLIRSVFVTKKYSLRSFEIVENSH